jgi:2-dehydropantoate 2-reductase
MVILSVKAHFTESALRPFVPMLGKDSFVVSMQNGLNEEYIAGMIGPERTVGCFIQFGADYIEPGHVLLAYDFPIWVGEIDGKMTDRAKMVGDILGHVMPATVTDNIWGYLWAKMCLGSIYFAGAVTAEKFADLLARDEFRQVFAAVVRETCTVARSVGVRVEEFPGFDPNLFMVSSASELGPAYAQWDPRPGAVGAGEMGSLKPYTGIQRDIIVRKRRTEVDKQPGDVVRKGREAAVPTPLNSKIVEMIHEIEDGKRPLSMDNLYELAKYVPAWR